ncbi:MAG: dethiobiotin synthase [Cytophagales bacterium]|nr:dethiobiotin synthase [Cytophagales bacterium]
MSRYFITAISTDSGKTLVSAIFTEAFKADYWKPVQSGLEERDTDAVKALISNEKTVSHPEAYALKTPMSPHGAAEIDGVEISLDKIVLPETQNEHFVIEGAGGMMVPLNDKDFVIDLVDQFPCEVILVSNLYLGSINHTILSINEIKRRGLNLKGIIFNGDSNPSSEKFIMDYVDCPCLLHIPQLPEVNQEVVLEYAEKLKASLKALG